MQIVETLKGVWVPGPSPSPSLKFATAFEQGFGGFGPDSGLTATVSVKLKKNGS